ncbi:MAG: UDP-N-acetylmuramoyl-L-alanine--D-glutamate ligase [Rhodocyclaceae bacterium]
MSYLDQHILVLGLGESGIAMARWLARGGARLRVADSRTPPPGLDELRRDVPHAEIVTGAFTDALLDGISLVAISPGLSIDAPLLQAARARGIAVTGEIELFSHALAALDLRSRARVIAITGTNGKTTTTTLAGELCRACGWNTAIAGNISPSALTELMRRVDANDVADAWVLELSSFQMETTDSLQADAATVLNVTDDHLDRHGTMADYAAMKARVFDGQGTQVLNRDDVYSIGMARAGRRQVTFGLDAPATAADWGVVERDGRRWLARGTTALMAADQLQLAGAHNVSNALAALALCEAVGGDLERMLEALRNFRGLPHRVERVARRADGVDYYDDSKGTNVGATIAALQGLGRTVVLIAGGDGKGQDFRPLSPVLRAHVRAAVLIGRDARRFADEVADSGIPLIHVDTLEAAVVEANRLALAGDALVLSPACASLDMFKNYAHRAQVFVDAVRQLPEVTPV